MPNDIETKWDGRGVPYQDFPGHKRRYISPLEASALSRALDTPENAQFGDYAEQGTEGSKGSASITDNTVVDGQWRPGSVSSGLDPHGMWRGGDTFNTETGSVDKGGLNWGAIIPLIIGATVTGGAGLHALGVGAGAGGAAAVASGATAPVATTGAAAGTAAATAAGGSMSLLDKIFSGVDILSNVLGGASKAGQSQNNTSDALKLALANSRLNQSKFAVDAPRERLNTSLKAALAKHAKPASVKWSGPGGGLRGEIPQFSGGIRSIGDALADPTMQSMSSRVGKDMATQEARGGASGGNQDMFNPADHVGESSAGDKALGGASFGASIFSALQKAGVFNRNKAKAAAPPDALPWGSDLEEPPNNLDELYQDHMRGA